MHIVLVEPQIPQNTGNIARTCAVTGTVLHLVRPLGFSTEDAQLRRAGLDYWHLLDIRYHDSLADFLAAHGDAKLYFFSTHGSQWYTQVEYHPDSFLIFGKETAGLPQQLLLNHPETSCRIPMLGTVRSLNLSNSVAIVVFEALRQQGFPGFS